MQLSRCERSALAFAGHRRWLRFVIPMWRVGGLMLPALFAVSVAQISIIINTNIASHLATGSVTWLAFADRLMEFPTALLGIALGTVLAAHPVTAFAEQRVEEYSHLLDWGLRLVFLLALPAAIGLGMTAEGIVSVLFQGRSSPRLMCNRQPRRSSVIRWACSGWSRSRFSRPVFMRKGHPYPGQDRDCRVDRDAACKHRIGADLCARRLGVIGRAGGVRQRAGAFPRLRRRNLYQPAAGWASFIARLALALAVLAFILWWAQQPLCGQRCRMRRGSAPRGSLR